MAQNLDFNAIVEHFKNVVTNHYFDFEVQSSIVISLSMRDVWLDYFRHHKEQVLRLRSGDKLNYADGYLLNQQGIRIASLSNAMRDRIKELEFKNYSIADVEISYVIAWRPREEQQEVAICLANLVLKKNVETSNNNSI